MRIEVYLGSHDNNIIIGHENDYKQINIDEALDLQASLDKAIAEIQSRKKGFYLKAVT